MLRAFLTLFALALLVSTAVHAQPVPEPQDYRMEDYRAPVPATLDGQAAIGADEVEALWSSGSAAFVDVMPRQPRPANLPQGTIWRDKERQGIPGSLWLPNVGYGALAPEDEAYFKSGLAAATGGDAGRTLVIYCMADCWMSWNAAKRAIGYGYRDVRWFAEGTDGWSQFGRPLVPLLPWSPGG
jgi:PQQ-dependent catabolism-associated CXXCW motif protein